MITQFSVAGLMLLVLFTPLSLHAAYDPASVASFTSHQDDEEEETRSFHERYSRSVQRAINKLDDDLVERMPIPVLFVSYQQLYPDFGDPRGGGTREHEGQDIIAPLRSFVISPTDAVVTRTGKGGSAGIYVYTANPGGESFRYMHLDEVAEGIKVGTVLEAGDLIGYVGNTGNATGGPHHLHFEIRDGREALDPYPRLDGTLTNVELIRSLTAIVRVLQQQLRDLE